MLSNIKLIFKFALKNIIKNKKRTLITSTAIFVGAIIVALSYGWIEGIFNNITNTYKTFKSGDFIIADRNYFKYEALLKTNYIIKKINILQSEIIEKLSTKFNILKNKITIIERLKSPAILIYDNRKSNCILMGVDFNNEKINFNITNSQIKNLKDNEILIGWRLAKKLNVKTGDKIDIAISTLKGEIKTFNLIVFNKVKLNITSFDKYFLFLKSRFLKKMIGLNKNATIELLIFINSKSNENTINKEIKKIVKNYNKNYKQNLMVKNYKESLSSFYLYLNFAKNMYYFIYSFIILLASFVVINTMMMNIFERINEIGTLKALGFKDSEIFYSFILEGSLIGAIGGIPGAISGYLLTLLLSKNGIDVSPMFRNYEILLNSIIYPETSLNILFFTIFLSIFITSLAVVSPSIYTKKLNPAEALRHL